MNLKYCIISLIDKGTSLTGVGGTLSKWQAVIIMKDTKKMTKLKNFDLQTLLTFSEGLLQSQPPTVNINTCH